MGIPNINNEIINIGLGQNIGSYESIRQLGEIDPDCCGFCGESPTKFCMVEGLEFCACDQCWYARVPIMMPTFTYDEWLVEKVMES